jgi:hypothetical protein
MIPERTSLSAMQSDIALLNQRRQPRAGGIHEAIMTQAGDIRSPAVIRRLTSDGECMAQTFCIEIALPLPSTVLHEIAQTL